MNLQRRLLSTRLLTLFSGLGGLTAWLPAQAKTQAQPDANGGDTPGVLLAKNAPPGIDPAGYLVSEKYDGVRALWDGSILRFRSGRPVAAPAWFVAKLPPSPLDGELWLARGQFDRLSGIVRKTQAVDAEWKSVNYMVFEMPAATQAVAASQAATAATAAVPISKTSTFVQRASQLQALVQQVQWPQLQAVAQSRVASPAALQALLTSVVAGGGEGLVLHLANAPLASGRSGVLLKLKPVQDAEATVLGHVAGKGKYQGMLGALELQTDNGQRFKLGTGFSDAQRASPPAIGSQITYTYRALTPSGKPRFAAFLRPYDGL